MILMKEEEERQAELHHWDREQAQSGREQKLSQLSTTSCLDVTAQWETAYLLN